MLKPSVGGTGAAWGRSTFALLMGSTVGGVTLGVGLSVLRLPGGTFARGTAVGLSLLSLCALFSPAVVRLLPERACQVRASAMFRKDPIQLGLLWGWQLGTGVATFSVTPVLYALLGACLALPSGISTVSVCAVYGLLRGAIIVSLAVAGDPLERGLPLGRLKRALTAPAAGVVLLSMPVLMLAE